MQVAKVVLLLWTVFCGWYGCEPMWQLIASKPPGADVTRMEAAGLAGGWIMWGIAWTVGVVPISLIGILFRSEPKEGPEERGRQ